MGNKALHCLFGAVHWITRVGVAVVWVVPQLRKWEHTALKISGMIGGQGDAGVGEQERARKGMPAGLLEQQ